MSRAGRPLRVACALTALLWVVTTRVGVAAPAVPSPFPGCAPAAPGGEWRTFGHDLANTRTQPDEHVIGTRNAASLRQAWAFSTEVLSPHAGDLTGTPIVADGCVYAGTNAGWVIALNADTGARVWATRLPQGAVNASVAVDGDKVVVAASRAGSSNPLNCVNPACAPRTCVNGCLPPTVVAFDRATGAPAWSTVIDQQPGADLYSSSVVYDGMALVGVSGGNAEFSPPDVRGAFQGNLVVLDTATGAVLAKVWAIHPPGQPADDYAGASIWSTPAVDTTTGYAYVGTGNPFNPHAEHPHANAILKIDLDRNRPTFGRVVGSYKGTVDEYSGIVSHAPCGDLPGNLFPYYPQGLGACGDIDLDFGAAPNLFTLATGQRVVGEGQKSGVYHVADTSTMSRVWQTVVAPPSDVGGIVGSTAYDGQRVYGPVTLAGYLWALRPFGGSPAWVAPVADAVHWGNPVTVANGVVYTLTLHAEVAAYAAATGRLITMYPMWSTAGPFLDPGTPSWGGVAVARNTVYATTGTQMANHGFVIALRPTS